MTADLSARLAAVNFFLGCVGVTQVTRILMHQRSQQGKSTGQMVEEDAKEAVDLGKGVTKNPVEATKKALN